jgi:hypothetical protein
MIIGDADIIGTPETSWDATTGTWDDQTSTVWGGVQVHNKLLSHGVAGGHVFQHTPNLYTRDGDLPAFVYVSSPQAMGDTSQFKQFQQVLIHYVQVALASGLVLSPIIVSLLDGMTGSIVSQHILSPTTNGKLLPKVVQAWFRDPLVQVQVSIMGTHPFVMRGFDVQWLPNMGDVR